MLLIIALLLFLLIFGAFFNASEMSIVTTRHSKIKSLADTNDSAKIIMGFQQEPSNFFSTVQVGVTLSSFFISALAAAYISPEIAVLLRPFIGKSSQAVAVIFETLIIAYITLVFAEVLPKNIGIIKSESVSLGVAKPLSYISFLLAPFSKIVSFSTKTILKILGYEPAYTHKSVSEEEFQVLIAEQQDLYPEERQLIQEAFEIGEVTIRQIMVPRNDIVALSSKKTIDAALGLSMKAGHTRIPIFEEDLDNIIGFIHIKDAISKLRQKKEKQNVKEILRPIFYAPETNKALIVLKQLQNSGVHIAVALDEYGGTAGVVTLEDILEEIVGEIKDEYDVELELIKPIGNNSYLVQGKTPVDDLNEKLETSIPVSPDYESVAGFLIFKFNRIPRQGESIVINDFKYTIDKKIRNRIQSIFVRKTS